VKAQQQVFAKQEDNIAKQQKVITEQQQSITELIYKMNEMETLLKNVAPKLGESDIYGFGQSIVLKQNTPNPTSQITNIEYALPEEITNALLVIYDMSGREINKYQVSGLGSIEFDVSKLVSGTYTYSIVANGINMITRKMVVQ